METKPIRRSNYQYFLLDSDNQLFQTYVGLFSILFGMIIAGAIIHFFPPDASSLEKARELGIIGRTVLDGYPKQSEIKYYIIGVIVSLISGLALFLSVTYIHYRKKSTGYENKIPIFLTDDEKQKSSMRFRQWVVLFLLIFLGTFHKDFIYKNWCWGSWSFYFEEGAYLRWINEILRGGVVYKDIYLQGGPLMVWPQYLLMKLFEPSVSIHRYYTYFCYFIGYIFVFMVSREIIKNKALLAIEMLIIIYLFYPMFPSLQQSLGRFTFSLIPLFLYFKSFSQKKSFFLFSSGFTLGLAFLSSQELGISSLFAIVVMSLAYYFKERLTARQICRQSLIFLIGLLVPTLPMLAYLSFHNAFSGFYEAMINMPYYYMVGHGLQFPNLFHFFNIFGKNAYSKIEILLAYWPIGLYIAIVFYCLTLFIKNSFTNKTILFFGIAALGGAIFQRAFGIYALSKIKNVIFPLLILSCGLFDMYLPNLKRRMMIKTNLRRQTLELTPYIFLLIFIVFGLSGYILYGFSPGKRPIRHRIDAILNRNGHYKSLNLPYARDIFIPVDWADKTKLAVKYIKQNTDLNEPIFVFPYSPMYYFLTDRPAATKFPVIYASARIHREQIIKDIDEKKVKYIIYNDDQKILLGVPTKARFSKLVDYLNENYESVKKYKDIFILKRKES